MDSRLTLSINDKQFEDIKKVFNKIDPTRQDSVAKTMMTKVGLLMERSLKGNLSGRILKRRTGYLAGSITSNVKNSEGNWKTTVGSGVRTGKRAVYANILEKGGTIKPNKSKFLAIPLRAALTGAGAPRKSGPRQWANTFVRRSHGGNLIIFQANGKGKIIPLYVLKKSVRIPGKDYMGKSLQETTESILRVMNNEVSEGLK